VKAISRLTKHQEPLSYYSILKLKPGDVMVLTSYLDHLGCCDR